MAESRREEVFDANPPGGGVLGAGIVDVIQARLNTMIGKSSGFLETLPAQMQARINFLRELQDKHDEYESAYQSELKALQAKYNTLYAPLYAERSAVVNGEKEVPKEEGMEEDKEDKPKEAAEEAAEPVPPGIPEFWLGVMRAHPLVSEHLSPKDEEVLAHLTDITSEDLEGQVDEDGDEMAGFKLSFHFKPNPFFDHKVLTKTYHIYDEDGEPMLHRAEGTDIEWKQGKNVTVKLLKKKAKPARGKPAAAAKTLTKVEPVASFFNFFKPPQEPEDEDVDEDEIEELRGALEEDFELGEVIRSRLIPNAVRWYTGEANEDDEDEDDEDEDDYGDGDDDEDDEDENDEDDEEEGEHEHGEAKGHAKQAAKGLKGGEGVSDKGEKPPECKQQ